MDILVYGAGVIGTLYGAKLQLGGHRVTVLARSERCAAIKAQGLVIENVVSGARSATRVSTVERLDPGDRYDLALITVRREQLSGILPALQGNRNIPTLLFMQNNPLGASELADTLGRERVLLGFPGAGGTLEGWRVKYVMIAQQPTTLGQLDGSRTARLRVLAKMLEAVGFRTHIERDMDAWLKAHAFFVTAVSGALYLCGGDCQRLSNDRATLRLMTSGVREGYRAVRALGRPIRPLGLNVLFNWMPQAFGVSYWRRFFSAPMADYVIGRHARSSFGEMRALADDCRTLLAKSGERAPSLERLYRAIDSYAERG